MTLGNNIKRIRKEAKLSQEDFAEKFCVTRQTVSNWENSKSYPDLETIIRISDSFEISLDILLKEDITMVKTIDHEVKSTRKYARALTVIAFIVVLLIGSFAVYSMVYFDTKKNLENNFEEQLEENDFYKNRDGYYTMNYADGVYYSVPNQSMPSLLDFDLHFHATYLWCDIDSEDVKVEIQWNDFNAFHASAVSKADGNIIGSTSEFKENDFNDMKKLGNVLGISEKEISEIIEKGNELYKDFYPQK